MSAEAHLLEGDLDSALTQLEADVRADPAASKHRVFLFQLLAIRGEWDRALTQLNVMSEMDAGTLGMVTTYRSAVACETFREEVFTGERSPLIFGEPPDWIALLLEALKQTAAGRYAEAGLLSGQALEAAPATPGHIDDQPFEWLADADSRLGPVIEAVINGRYYWVPVANVRELKIEPPTDLRDFVWAAAHFTWTNGGETVALLPSRYPGSDDDDDPLIRLGRKTAWEEVAKSTFLGRGQKALMTDAGEYALLDVRKIRFDDGRADGS